MNFPDFTEGKAVSLKHILIGEKVMQVTTVFDLMLAQYGVNRGLLGDYPLDYEDEAPYTPAWQEKITKVSPGTVIQVAREFAQNARDTKGRSMIIMGAGINHWYNGDTIYRAIPY